MDKKQHIIDTFLALVTAKNTCRISMDQLAKELGMSKKTIYTHFSSKEELMKESILYVNARLVEKKKEVQQDSETDIIENLYYKSKIVAQQLQFLSNELIREIQQDYPHLWKMIEDFRIDDVQENELLFAKAIQQGKLKSIDPKLIVHVYQTCLKEFTTQEFLHKHNMTMSESCQLLLSIILEGILMEK